MIMNEAFNHSPIHVLLTVCAAVLAICLSSAARAADPLPSCERIANFDNGGTLWVESPFAVKVIGTSHESDRIP
jgi:hypothetical protein